jgi:hypothetical protein
MNEFLGPFENADLALEELRRVVAEIIGADPDTWPEHKNATLAIAAAVGLRESHVKRLTEERDALRARIEEMEKQEPFDADSDVFRSSFEAALKAGNWPATRQGDGYRSPSTQIAWRIAFSTVNRLKLYLAPGAKGEEK